MRFDIKQRGPATITIVHNGKTVKHMSTKEGFNNYLDSFFHFQGNLHATVFPEQTPAPIAVGLLSEERRNYSLKFESFLDRKICAIKIIRDMTGLGLYESKCCTDNNEVAQKYIRLSLKKALEIASMLKEKGVDATVYEVMD
jgi:ribosomal protein L7/L12